MEDINNKKCSLLEHKEIDAILYCQECKIFMCNKCDNNHSTLFKTHHKYKLDNLNIKDIFTGFCKEENHPDVLEFFCKNHNTLCCSSCLCKIKKRNKGQHFNCEVCEIEEIKEEKKNKLNDNYKYLEDLSKNVEKSINDLKNILEKIGENKEKIKLDIQNIFTKIRTILNEKEDQLLNEVDNEFNKLYFKEDLIKECEKLPNKIKISLENGKKTIEKWKENENNKLNFLINDCLIIEKNIEYINKLEEIRKKSNLNDSSKITLFIQKEEINELINSIKKLNLVNDEPFPSEILKDKIEDKKLIISWLPQKPNKITLLLNSKIDGDSCKTLIEKCKGKKPTLVVIQTTKDIIFGGYITQEWNEDYKDEKAFVYSLKTRKKYNVKEPNYAKYAGENNWWGFGYSKNAIVLYDNCLKRTDNYVGNKAYDIPQPYELNGGEQSFNVKSYEIFYIE